MLEKQNHVCYLCKSPPTEGRRLYVDHCHSTGKVRSLLCHSCNLVLGHTKDNIETLKKMIIYLEEHSHE